MHTIALGNVVEKFCKEVGKDPSTIFNVCSLNNLDTEFAVLFNDGTYMVIAMYSVNNNKQTH